MKKIIYLDWNVFKNMIKPRKEKYDIDILFKENVLIMRNKFVFPYSSAHIEDRLSRYNPEYEKDIKADLLFVSNITGNKALVYNESNEIGINDYNIFDAFQEVKDNTISSYDINTNFPSSFFVDVSQVSKDHPMYNFIIENNGQMTPQLMDNYLSKMCESFIVDTEPYKNLRKYLSGFNLDKEMSKNHYSSTELCYVAIFKNKCGPLLDSFEYNEDKLLTEWTNIITHYFSSSISPDKKIIYSYGLLDFHPLFYDKLKKKKNTPDNIRRDANHCLYASKCDYYVSEDERTRKKTIFIYKAFDIKTTVLSEEEFNARFQIS